MLALSRCCFAMLLAVIGGCGDDVGTVMRGNQPLRCLPVSDGGSSDAGMDGSMDASVDAAIDLDAGEICDENELCLMGHCTARCENDDDCDDGGMCTAELVCVARALIDASLDAADAAMDADAGPAFDAGPDMCEGLVCASNACHSRLGVCVECVDESTCNEVEPICNTARAACVAPDPKVCGPCRTDADCLSVIVEGTGARCVYRPETNERVCAIACPSDRACPVGFGCNSALFVCLPNSSCEQYNAAIERRTCSADTECAPLGVPAAPGSCMGGGMPGVRGQCRQSCSATGDCTAGMTCSGGFCG